MEFYTQFCFLRVCGFKFLLICNYRIEEIPLNLLNFHSSSLQKDVVTPNSIIRVLLITELLIIGRFIMEEHLVLKYLLVNKGNNLQNVTQISSSIFFLIILSVIHKHNTETFIYFGFALKFLTRFIIDIIETLSLCLESLLFVWFY